jgi:predicted nucleic acid-binding protein
VRVYLDNCCFNRPFDDQRQLRILLETKAKLAIQELIKAGKLELIWSFVLSYEVAQIKAESQRILIAGWKAIATQYIGATRNILDDGKKIQLASGIRDKDALHLASAVAGRCDYFITTDDIIITKAAKLTAIKAVDPMDFLKMENLYEN